MKVLSKNSKAYFNYTIVSEYLAGIVLQGWQVKSCKEGSVSLKEAYCYLHQDELWLRGANISPWKTASAKDLLQFKGKNPSAISKQDLKLLLTKPEILKIAAKLRVKGYTIIPLELLESKGLIKVKIALVTGKKQWDKRAQIKQREQKRELERELKGGKFF